MKEIRISQGLKELCPQAALGCIQCKVTVAESQPKLLKELEELCKRIQETYEKAPDLPKRRHIAETRTAYKALGKEPGRYRNSSEAMCRRILQGKGLYHINNVVECNNLFSIETGYSLGAYDVEKIKGSIVWKAAGKGACYQGIGKEQINIECLPALFDQEGAFGNPTSDSVRTRITEDTREILMCIFAFGGTEKLKEHTDQLAALLKEYCGAEEIQTAVLECV